MSVKSKVLARLQTVKALEGVFPTGVMRSDVPLGRSLEIAKRMRSNRVTSAVAASKALLMDALHVTGAVDSAVEMLSGSRGGREQVAGFAQAGIAFFHASVDYARKELAQREDEGGNGTISRVMMEGSRILLEPQRIVLRFEQDATEAVRRSILARHRLAPIGRNGLPPDTIRVATEARLATDVALALMEEDAVVFAEPDFVEFIGRRHNPDDPRFPQQWHHLNIAAPAAWDLTRGEGIRIAVIDNGFDTGHKDLAYGDMSGWFRDTDDITDADFVPGIAGMPDSNHGTACAGMIGAIGDNARGGCGVAFASSVSAIACAPDQVGTQSTLARAIGYAARPSDEDVDGVAGADIISCSLGPNSASWTMRQVLSDAIDAAATGGRDGRGTLILWACTNGNFPISSDEVCSHPQVCAVGRSTDRDLDNGSGFGPELEFLAPGVRVLIPASGNTYHTTTGTSFAAPCAAGVAALALSRKPGLTALELRQVMRESCDKVGPLPYVGGRNPRFGHGRVNAAAAVRLAENHP